MRTKQEAIAHIQGPALQTASEAVRLIRPFTLQNNTLHIAPGTRLYSTVTKELDQVDIAGDAANIPLQHPVKPGRTRFDAALRSAERIALRSILVSLATFLDTRPDDPPNHVYHDLEVQEAARAAAKAAMPPFPEFSHQTPGELGYSMLTSLLGERTVAATLEVFGPNAALKHAALYSRYPNAIRKAADTQPNAIMLLGARSYLSNRNHLTLESPQDALQKAKDGFRRDVHYRTAPGRGTPQRNEDDNAELLWAIFLALPNDVIRETRLEDVGPNIVRLCENIAETQVIPRSHVLATLLQNTHILRTAPKPLLHAFIHHGPDADTDEGRAQAAGELATLHALTQASRSQVRRGRESNRVTRAIHEHEDEGPIRWQALLTAAQKDIQDQKGKHRKRSKAPNSMELDYVFRHPAADDVLLISAESPTWTQGPATSMKLFAHDPEKPFLEILSEPDHTLHLRAAETLSTFPIIPGFHQKQAPGWSNNKNRLDHLFDYQVTQSLMQGALEYLRDNWDDLKTHPNLGRPTSEQAANAIRAALYATHSKPDYVTQQFKIAEEIDAGLQALALQGIAHKAAAHAHNITTFHYNAVIKLGDQLEQLARTNPGAVAWVMNHVTDTKDLGDTLRHPGQLITIAKETLHRAGLHPRNWKFVAALNNPFIKETQPTQSQMLVLLLNAMAAAGHAPPPDTASFILNMVLAPAYRKTITNRDFSPEQKELAAENTTLILTLLCRQHAAGGRTNALMDQALDTMDYTLYASERGGTIRSTTWNGLLKAAHEWHRDTRQAEILAEWERSHTGRNRKPRSWKSLVGPTTKGEFEIQPLTSEYQLFQESREMNHCVVNYAQNCRQGDRIFSVLRNGIKLATSQIRKTPDGWQEVQTRGRDNHAVSHEIHEVMREIARDYELAALEEEQREACAARA